MDRMLSHILIGILMVCAVNLSGEDHIENPDLFADEKTVAVADAAPTTHHTIVSKPSPTGSGIWYPRDEIEDIAYPHFEGDRNQVAAIHMRFYHRVRKRDAPTDT